jgi:hypothetical protein
VRGDVRHRNPFNEPLISTGELNAAREVLQEARGVVGKARRKLETAEHATDEAYQLANSPDTPLRGTDYGEFDELVVGAEE